MNAKFEEDILSIGGNDPEKTLEVAQNVFKRLDVIAESIFLPDDLLGYMFCSGLVDNPAYTELHKDITALFLSKYLKENPSFLLADRSTGKYLRIFQEKRILYMAHRFICRYLKNTDREGRYPDLERHFTTLDGLHDRRVKLAAEWVGVNGRELISVSRLDYIVPRQRNKGFIKYCIDAGFSLMENELKPFLDEVKDWHDLIESPAYGNKGVCITKYDFVYEDYFTERCLQIARDWDWKRWE